MERIKLFNEFNNQKNSIKESKVFSYNDFSETENIDEGAKEIIMGLAFLANIGLGGGMAAKAQNALSKDEVVNKIERVMQNRGELERIVSQTQSGDTGAKLMARIEQNAEKIKDKIEDLKKSDIITIQISNDKDLVRKIKQGYALTKISVDTIRQEVKEKMDEAPVFHTLDVEYDLGDFFGAGEYILSEDAKSELKGLIDEIKTEDLKIMSIGVNSSTDKQRVSDELSAKLKNYLEVGDEENANKLLSQARNLEIVKVLEELGISQDITSTIEYEKGEGELGAATPQDPSARYVKMEITLIKISEVKMPGVDIEETFQITKDYELVYVKSTKGKPGPPVKIKNPGIKNSKKCGATSCPGFGSKSAKQVQKKIGN